jgi:nitroreductase
MVGDGKMAVPVMETLRSHRSIRKYKPDPIPEDLLDQILTAARQAPTSSNLQAYSIVVVKNPDTKRTLSEFAGHQPWVADCPVFLVMCPDLHRLDRVCQWRGYQFSDRYLEILLVAIVDTALVAQNILVAAEGAGLGVCMIGGVRNNPDKVAGVLSLPDRVFPLMGLCLGYPDHEPMIKPRLQPEVVIHSERYQESELEGLLEDYDRLVKASGLYEGSGRQVPAPDGRTVPDEDYSWMEHTARRAAATDLRLLRAHLRTFLERRKFGLG